MPTICLACMLFLEPVACNALSSIRIAAAEGTNSDSAPRFISEGGRLYCLLICPSVTIIPSQFVQQPNMDSSFEKKDVESQAGTEVEPVLLPMDAHQQHTNTSFKRGLKSRHIQLLSIGG